MSQIEFDRLVKSLSTLLRWLSKNFDIQVSVRLRGVVVSRKWRCCKTNALGVHTYGMSSITRTRYNAVDRMLCPLGTFYDAIKFKSSFYAKAGTMRKIAFFVGLFALVMGLFTYDQEVATAPVPIITGVLVMLLALFNMIPEFVNCSECGKKIPKKSPMCRFCKTAQDKTDR